MKQDTFYVAKQAGDARFLRWLHDRLEFVHGENPDVDYMHRLRDFVTWFEGDPLAERDAAVAALRSIADSHIPDQPASDGGDEVTYVRRKYAELRQIARAVLASNSGRMLPAADFAAGAEKPVAWQYRYKSDGPGGKWHTSIMLERDDALDPTVYEQRPTFTHPISLKWMLEEAFLAGWNASGEGWNGEFPEIAGRSQQWLDKRYLALMAILCSPREQEGTRSNSLCECGAQTPGGKCVVGNPRSCSNNP